MRQQRQSDLVEAQQRHLVAAASLMARDLDSILQRLDDEHPTDPTAATIRESIESIRYHLDHLSSDLNLEISRQVSPVRHARAVAAAWLSRIPDLGPESLANYGPDVPAATAERLRRLLAPLQHEFERLLRSAS